MFIKFILNKPYKHIIRGYEDDEIRDFVDNHLSDYDEL